MKDVIWKVQGSQKPVWHLFECWTHGMSYKRATTPMCKENAEAIVHRQDGMYCRICIGIEGAVV